MAELATALWIQNNQPDRLADYERALQLRVDFDQLLGGHKTALDTLYAQNADVSIMRAAKQRLTRKLHVDYARLKAQRWEGDERYDDWFAQPINNARLAGFASYRDLVAEFKLLFQACDSQFRAFFTRLDATLETDDQGSYLVPSSCSIQ